MTHEIIFDPDSYCSTCATPTILNSCNKCGTLICYNDQEAYIPDANKEFPRYYCSKCYTKYCKEVEK